ncbi:MAG: NupC/NupG family nucleoside CNT transporter [Vicinamibacterales bacterium]
MIDVNDPTGRQRLPLRGALAGAALLLAVLAYLLEPLIGSRGQAAIGAVVFVSIVAACSRDIEAVNWRTVGWGIALQVLLALAILKLNVGGVRPGYAFFSGVAAGVRRFLEFTDTGSRFVFGGLADPGAMSTVFPGGVVFAFTALPTIVFVSSFFSVLYHLGVLQLVVRLMAKGMMRLMKTSGAETLSAAANVFMGQTEAPIIVKPFVPDMTNSELLAMMVGGTATISGGMMIVYIGLGADPIAMLTTSVMAAPCGLYLSKILYPETGRPLTSGYAEVAVGREHVNLIDAAAGGAADGTRLAVNVAAMLIAFLAFLAMFDHLLALAWPGLTLARVFAWVFAPVAMLIGVPRADVFPVADLLGTKLVANEFVAFVKLSTQYKGVISERSHALATFALTGFANFGSIGIQLGGIGAMAPTRRGDLARLGTRALFVGFAATLVNACIAAVLL